VTAAIAPSLKTTRPRPARRAQLGALLYLQLRIALRKWELVARDPLRRLAWAPFAASFVWLLGARIFGLHVQPPASIWRYVDALLPPFMFLMIAMSRAAGGRLYQSRAHAHLVGGLGIPVWLLIAWQHLQRLPIMLWNLGLFGVVLLPSLLGVGPVRVVESVIALMLAFTFLGGGGLIGFAVRLRSAALGKVWSGFALGIAAILSLPLLPLVTGISMPWLQPVRQAAAWSPGGLVVSGASGNPLADLGLLAFAAGTLAFGIAITRNLGPDLAEASYRFFMLVDSARAGGTPVMSGANMRLRDPVQRSTATSLSGAGVVAWKTWLEFRRGATGRWRLLGMASQVLLGVMAGWLWLALEGSHVPASLKTLLIAGAVLSMVGVGFSSGRQFGPLLRNPLFALNRDPLARRLLAVLLTRQATESIGSLATVVGLALVLPALTPLLVVFMLVGRAVGIGMLGLDLYVFAWLPSATDRTMAMRIIRTAVVAVLVPAGTLLALWAFRTPVPELVLLLPIPVFLLLGWRLITAAGARLEGNGLAIAIAERR
jgi:hypothetical protein